jgi:hypothetical protein
VHATEIFTTHSAAKLRNLGVVAMVLGLLVAALTMAAPARAASRPAWPKPVTLSGPGARGAPIAIDAKGDALAVWSEYAADGWRQRYRWYAPGRGWGRPGVLRGAGGEPFVRVALTPRGEATVLWDERKDGGYQTWVTTAPPGGTFARPRQISNGLVTTNLLVDDEGGALLVQSQLDVSDGGALLVSGRQPGGDFGPPQRLAAGPASSAAAISPAGAAAVVWSPSDGKSAMLSYRPAGGDFQPPERLDVPVSPRTPLAINTAGEVVVAGSRVNPYTGSQGTTLSVRSPLGSWGAPIALDVAGTVLQAFTEANGDVSFLSAQPDESITLTTRHADGSVAGPARIKGAKSWNFFAAASYRGNMLATWNEHYGDFLWRDDITRVAERPAGRLFGPAVTVSGPGTANGPPAINDAGAAALVWLRQTKSGDLGSVALEAIVRDASAEAPIPPSLRITDRSARKVDAHGTIKLPVRCSQGCRVRARGLLFVDGAPVGIGRPQSTDKRLRARKVGQVGVRFNRSKVAAAGGRAWASISVTAKGRSPRPITITRRIRIRH